MKSFLPEGKKLAPELFTFPVTIELIKFYLEPVRPEFPVNGVTCIHCLKRTVSRDFSDSFLNIIFYLIHTDKFCHGLIDLI